MAVEIAMTIAGRYRLDSVVGRGSTAEVWAAFDTVLSRKVALKLLGPRSDLEKSRIWREARLAALLGETAAVPIFDFGDDGESCFLVMELVSEPSLREFLTTSPDLGERIILTLALELMEALVASHALNIVHRDIKPENLFVLGTPTGIQRVRLVDFGLAFVSENADTSLGRLTEAGVLSGTPAYLSPEQAQGQDLDPATDIYSAGCVLYECACGMPPFDGSLAEVLSKHMYVPPISLQERGVTLPEAFLTLVERMLAKSAQDRVTALEALEIMVALVDGDSASLGRAARGAARKSRDERMIDAPLASGEGPDISVIRATAHGAPPSWLLATLDTARIELVDQEESPEVLFIAAGGEIPEGGDTPCVVWLDDSSTTALVDVISRGADFAISPQTSTRQLRRTVLRLRKSSQAPDASKP